MAEEVANGLEANTIPQRGPHYGNIELLLFQRPTASSQTALEIGGLKQQLFLLVPIILWVWDSDRVWLGYSSAPFSIFHGYSEVFSW